MTPALSAPPCWVSNLKSPALLRQGRTFLIIFSNHLTILTETLIIGRQFILRGIAQLVEQRSPKPRVVGSIPTAPARKTALAFAKAVFVLGAAGSLHDTRCVLQRGDSYCPCSSACRNPFLLCYTIFMVLLSYHSKNCFFLKRSLFLIISVI